MRRRTGGEAAMVAMNVRNAVTESQRGDRASIDGEAPASRDIFKGFGLSAREENPMRTDGVHRRAPLDGQTGATADEGGQTQDRWATEKGPEGAGMGTGGRRREVMDGVRRTR